MNFKEKIEYIHKHLFGGTNKTFKYANSVQLTGYILNRPYEIEMVTGHIMATFVLIIVKSNGVYTYCPCETHSQQVIDMLKKLEYGSFVSILGCLHRIKYDILRVQVEEMQLIYDFPSIDIDENPYNATAERLRKGGKDNEE